MDKFVGANKTVLETAYCHYNNISTVEPVRLKFSSHDSSPDDITDRIKKETICAVNHLKALGYLDNVEVFENQIIYRITEKGISYFDPETRVQNNFNVERGSNNIIVSGNSNQINQNIKSDIFLDIQSSDLADEHKALLSKLFAELMNSSDKAKGKKSICDFIEKITVGAITDSAKSALAFAIQKGFGI